MLKFHMPAKLKYGFLCDGAMLVQGKWTFQGIFDKVFAQKFPAIHPEAVLAFKFSGPVGAHALRVNLKDSRGGTLLEARQALECLEFKDTDVVIGLKGIPLPAEGFYAFQLSLDDEKEPFGAIDFQVHKVGAPRQDSA